MTARRACAWVALACSLLQVSGCSTTEPAPPPSEYYVFDAAGAAGAGGVGQENAGAGGTTPTVDAGANAAGAPGGGGAASSGGGPSAGAETAGAAVEAPRERDATAEEPGMVPTYADLPCVLDTAYLPEDRGVCPAVDCDAIPDCGFAACETEDGGCGLRYAPDGGNYEGHVFPEGCNPTCEPRSYHFIYIEAF